MSDLGPNSRDRLRNERMPGEPVTRDRGGMAMIGLAAAVAVLVLAGLFFWSANDGDRTVSDKSPAATTGASPTSPAPATPPSGGNTPAQPSR